MTNKHFTESFVAKPVSVAAMMKANQVIARSYGQLAHHLFEAAQQYFERAIEVNAKLAGAKSAAEIADLQKELARHSFESAVAQGKMLSDLTSTTMREVAASFDGPLSEPSSQTANPKNVAKKTP